MFIAALKCAITVFQGEFLRLTLALIPRQRVSNQNHTLKYSNLDRKHRQYCSIPALACSKKFHIYNFLSFQDGNNCTCQYLIYTAYFWFRYQKNKNIFLGLRSQSENEILLQDFCLNQKVEIPIQILATFFFGITNHLDFLSWGFLKPATTTTTVASVVDGRIQGYETSMSLI